MATKMVIEGSDNVTASQLKEFYRQIDECNINGQQLQAFLEHRNPFEAPAFKTWKVIKLGVRKNTKEYRKAIKAKEQKISIWANNILGKPAFNVSATEKEISLVNLSVVELGFKNGATYRGICERAKNLGLDLCPAEVGPALREQYTDQLKDECVIVAMEPIIVSGDGLNIFSVGRGEGDAWLDIYCGTPCNFFAGFYRFVFRLRK